MFKKYMKPTYIDIGAWIGSTIFYANECGAKNIYAIEANPESFKHLIYNCEANKIEANLINKCIYSESNKIIKFGRSTSSNSSINDGQFDVISITYKDYINSLNVTNTKFVKVDIEGYEENIISELDDLTYLSLHPPFWKNKQEAIERLSRFNYFILAKTDEYITFDKLAKMCLSKDEFPSWGTEHGNFFEVLVCV